ncbi:MAG: T9SS type A sorting domain-containing protein [Bacteroidia bacterium]|nr:T9SS type A sorting domain-containing protein [Bacteroidia bacterium]
MKKLLLPLSILVITLFFAGMPYLPTGVDSLNQIKEGQNLPYPLLPAIPYNYSNQRLPRHISAQAFFNYKAPNNTLTDMGATLGRVLFYDTRLSVNHTVSCASCHIPQFGFSDTAKVSRGFDGALGHRQSMGLTNASAQPMQKFFWSASEDVLQNQIQAAITSSIEMGLTLDTLVARMQSTSFYSNLFDNAFGSPEITAEKASAAIGQFVRSMTSKNSKFDIAMVLDPKEHVDSMFFIISIDSLDHFTKKENAGMRLFISKGCHACHLSSNFVQFFPSNNGLDIDNVNDKGLGGETGNLYEEGLFKATSLRNVELTAPYMHDGRFNTLEEVIEHYNSGVKANPNLASELKGENGNPIRMNLTTYQKEALVAFLKTLTDTIFTSDPRWQTPFSVYSIKPVRETPMDKILNSRTLSVDPAFPEGSVKLFPNPFSDHLNIQFPNEDREEVTAKLFDMKGQLIFQTQTHGLSFRIERAGILPGNYVLQLRVGESVSSKLVQAR